MGTYLSADAGDETLRGDPRKNMIDRAATLNSAPRWAQLYAEYGSWAVRVAFLVSGDEEFAQDIAHDAFLKAATRYQHIRKPDSFKAYLRRTIINSSRNHARRKQIYFRKLSLLIEREEAPDGLQRIEGAQQLRPHLMSLPYRQRAAIVLKFFEDLDDYEIATMLRCTPAAAKSLVRRSVLALRSRMEGGDDARL